MEYLTRMLSRLESDKYFSYHLHCKEMRLNHLTFADDLMFFSKADKYSPMAMKAIFEEFSASSGLQINNDKSNVFISGVSTDFKEGKLLVRYLGVPLIASRLSIKDCSPIVQRVKQRIDSWVNKMLSLAGRIQLVNSVLFHITAFWCNAFILPIEVIKEIESCYRNFVWTGNWKGMPSISWKKMCHPRIEGGLGIKQLEAWNRAAMGKHLWTLMTNPSNLWSTWMRNKLKGRSIWAIEVPQDCSWAWRKILQLRTSIHQHIEVIVGDGRECSLFFDNWLNGKSLIEVIGNNECVNQWGSLLRVSDWRVNGEWNVPTIFRRIYPVVAAEIMTIQCNGGQDKFLWKPEVAKEYSVASCYEILRSKKDKATWSAFIWCKSRMLRHSVIWWLAIHGKLKTKDFLLNRGMHINGNCCFCNYDLESISQILFSCPFSNQIWKGVLLMMEIRRTPMEWENGNEFRADSKEGPERRELIEQFWHIQFTSFG